MSATHIDDFLSAPLRDVDDNGFSRTLEARLLAQNLRRRRLIEGSLLSSAAVACVAGLASTGAGALVARVVPEIIMSPAMQLGFVLTAASLLLARQLTA